MASVFSMHGSGMTTMSKKEGSKYQFKKGDKAPKDENAPKKPLSAYFRFMADNRKKAEEKNPGPASEVSKVLAQMWKDLSKDKKGKYDDAFKRQKAIYEKLSNAYKLSADFRAFQEKLQAYKIYETTLSYKKDPNMPKKSLSSYMLYGAHARPTVMKENPGIKITEVMTKISEKWNALDEKAKSKWNKKAEEAKSKHAKVLEDYMKSKERAAYEAEKAEYQKKMKDKRQALVKKGVKRVLETPDEAPKPKKQAVEKKKSKEKTSKKSDKKSEKKSDKKKGSKKSKARRSKSKSPKPKSSRAKSKSPKPRKKAKKQAKK